MFSVRDLENLNSETLSVVLTQVIVLLHNVINRCKSVLNKEQLKERYKWLTPLEVWSKFGIDLIFGFLKRIKVRHIYDHNYINDDNILKRFSYAIYKEQYKYILELLKNKLNYKFQELFDKFIDTLRNKTIFVLREYQLEIEE